jgi:hypothetical protein
MKESVETIICWGALLVGAAACLVVMWLLLLEVRRGKSGRFRATVVQGLAAPFLGAVPLVIAYGAQWLAKLGGVALFARDGGNDGLLVGVGIMGMIAAFGAAVLFAGVMVVQALTGWGSSE